MKHFWTSQSLLIGTLVFLVIVCSSFLFFASETALRVAVCVPTGLLTIVFAVQVVRVASGTVKRRI